MLKILTFGRDLESFSIRRVFLLVGLAVSASACAGKPPPLALVEPQGADGAAYDVLVATNRAPIDDREQRYGDGRSDDLAFNAISVWVPNNRTPGSISYPSDSPNIDQEFAITRFDSITSDQFLELLNNRLAGLTDSKSVFVFVHGYNVPYSSGVYRIAQIVADFENDSVPVHYSWPSSGKPLGYMYDRDSVQFARDGFAELLTELVASNAESIFLMGHSMGGLLVMETLRQLSLTGRDEIIEKIAPLVLASPDIDNDVFRSQLLSLSIRPDPIIVFVASDDNALRLSQRLRGGHPRVGEGLNISDLQDAGITVIDLSDIELGDGTQHSAFASSPELIKLFRQASIARDTLAEADSDTIESPLDLLSKFTQGIIFLPKRVIESP
jgi:esterase/lipase superfamily enzyme